MSENKKWLLQGQTTKEYYLSEGSNAPFHSATVTFDAQGMPVSVEYTVCSGPVSELVKISTASLQLINNLLNQICLELSIENTKNENVKGTKNE